MSVIERDDRRWTLGRSYMTGAPTAKEGPFLADGETVEVVPASQLQGAIEALRALFDASRPVPDGVGSPALVAARRDAARILQGGQ